MRARQTTTSTQVCSVKGEPGFSKTAPVEWKYVLVGENAADLIVLRVGGDDAALLRAKLCATSATLGTGSTKSGLSSTKHRAASTKDGVDYTEGCENSTKLGMCSSYSGVFLPSSTRVGVGTCGQAIGRIFCFSSDHGGFLSPCALLRLIESNRTSLCENTPIRLLP